MTTYAMVMQASRTTCDLRSLTPMTKLGSRTLSCWGKSSRSAAPFMIKARNSLNWNTKADHHHHTAVLAGTTEQEWPEEPAGKCTPSHPWFLLLQSPVVWNMWLSKTNSLLFLVCFCFFVVSFFCFFLCVYISSSLFCCCFEVPSAKEDGGGGRRERESSKETERVSNATQEEEKKEEKKERRLTDWTFITQA